MNTQEMEFGNELEFGNEFEQEFEFGQELGSNQESYELETNNELHESLEMELAHELLNVSNEQELNQFLGKFIRRVGSGLKKFANSSIGQTLGGALKGVLKKTMPLAGSALGGLVGGPVGAMIGGKLAGAASNLFELEMEGLSPEDREFEVARAYIRFANDAIQNSARLYRRFPNVNSQALINRAINQSARSYAPGLLTNYSLPTNRRSVGGSLPTRGSWHRHGNRITIYL